MKYQTGDIIIDELKGFKTYIGIVTANKNDWFDIGKMHNSNKYLHKQTRLLIESNKFTRLICSTL